MPSTYTTNLGIQKPANGEQSGTWGGTVNTNSDILDRAINGSLSLSLSGTSSTLTTSQGVTSNGQFKVLELTGTPSGTHTITIDPATAQTLYLVNNTTAQSVIFTQGSGGNVTIVSGASAIIYSSGAGAAAKVTNLTNVFAMSGVKITGGTISGVTITGITDLAVADGGTGASTLTGYVKGAGTAALTASATIPNTDITGLGTMSTQAASAVAITGGTITGGTITGITDLAIADGGTGASTGAGAVSNFGITATIAQLNFVGGVTSAIQTQLDAKAPLASPALTGTPIAPTAANLTNTTQLATTAFVLANVPLAGAMTLLGTLNTTSGTTQTLSGLTLTTYAALLITVDNVSHDNATARHLRLSGQQVSAANGASASSFNGPIFVSLTSGQSISMVLPDTGTASFRASATAITTASTSLQFTWDGAGNFDAGIIKVWGLK